MGWQPVRLTVPRTSGRAEGRLVYSSLARLVASGAADNRGELVRATGLARSTVSTHLEPLLAAGVLTEAGAEMARNQGRGRPAHRLALSPDAGIVAVADVGAHSTRLALADLGQRVLAEREVALDVSIGPDAALAELAEQLWSLLGTVAAHARPSALVMGLPGPVDSAAGVPVRPPIMPGWDGYAVGAWLTERFGCPALVDNDVNLMALGEARALPTDQAPMLFLKIGTGIGGGIIDAAGQLHSGADGAACDIGHIRVPDADAVVCQCGNVGCVEAVASAGAILRRLSESAGPLSAGPPSGGPSLVGVGTSARSTVALGQLLRDGDPEAVRLVRAAAATIGEVVAMLVHFYNPSRVALGGLVTVASGDMLAGIRSVVYQRALPLATRHLTLATSVLGRHAGLAGGVVAAVELVLSPDGIEQLLRDRRSVAHR